MTVADRSDMRDRIGAGKPAFGQLSSCGRLELSKVGKDDELVAKDWECFFNWS